MAKETYVVAFYELDRVYGGPEEGGWWYNTGDLIRVFKVVHNGDLAATIANRANELLDKLQKEKADIYSMGYSGGRYAAYVYPDKAPEHWPEQRPYYE